MRQYKIRYVPCSAMKDELARRRAKAFDTAFAVFTFYVLGSLLLALVAILIDIFQ